MEPTTTSEAHTDDGPYIVLAQYVGAGREIDPDAWQARGSEFASRAAVVKQVENSGRGEGRWRYLVFRLRDVLSLPHLVVKRAEIEFEEVPALSRRVVEAGDG